MIQPPKELVYKFVPIVCKVVGAVFIFNGIVALLIIPLFLSSEMLIVFVLCFAAVASIGIGTAVFKFFPKFLLATFDKQHNLLGKE